MRTGCMLNLKKTCDLNTVNDILENDSILAICMTNLSKFHIVFSSSALICLNKDALEGHLCQTVNHFVNQN